MSASPALPRATLVFAALTALLSAALFLEVRENRRLRRTLLEMTHTRAREHGFVAGQRLAPIELVDGAGAPVPVRFTDSVGTVLLFHSGGCDACANTAPRWRSALAEAARPDLALVVAQTDGESGRVDLEGLPPSLVVPLPPDGWHAGLPAVPATLVIDAEGGLVQAWFGELDEAQRVELVRTLLALGT